MANIGDVNDTEFQASVLDSQTPVLVDFWAEWCVPCHMVSPVVEEIGQEKGQDLKVAKLNIDENPDATRTYGVMSIPSLILFKAGKEVARVTGARPKDAILRDLTRTWRRTAPPHRPRAAGCRRARVPPQTRTDAHLSQRRQRSGDRGHPVEVDGPRRRRRRRGARGGVRVVDGGRRPLVPEGAAPAGRRPRRPRHLGAARRGRLAARRPHAVPPRPDVPRRRRAGDPADAQRTGLRQRQAGRVLRPPDGRMRSGCSSGTSGTNRTASWLRTRCRCSDGCARSTPRRPGRSCGSARNWMPHEGRSRDRSSPSMSAKRPPD